MPVRVPIRVVLSGGTAEERKSLSGTLAAAGCEVVEVAPGTGPAAAPPQEPVSLLVTTGGTALAGRRFSAALAGSPISVWTQDAQLRYVWAFNTSQLFGDVDPVGRTDAEIISEADLQPLAELKQGVLELGQGRRGEVSIHAGDDIRTFDIHLQPLFDERGDVAGLAGTAVDMTESKRWEASLRHTQKLESIGVLAGGIAHDFNNLLTTILGNSTLALEEIGPDHPARRFIAAAIGGAEQAARLTGQMLAYAGKGRFVIELVDLSELVQRIVNLIEASIPKAVRLHLSLRPNLPPIAADATQIQQLVMNLVINAGEAIGDHAPGTIRVNTGIQRLSETYIERSPVAQSNGVTPGDYVYLEIRDTGSGMDAETKAKIFDPFFTTKFTGRGLGLAAVDGIIRAHRGTLELYSAPGRGTTFKVLFPVAVEAERHAAETVPPVAERIRAGTVLVADDDESIRTMVRAALERHGYSVVLAEDGDAALAVFEQAADTVSAALLDMEMPGMEIKKLVGHIRQRRPGLPVVLASGYPESDVRTKFASPDAPAFVAKPFTADRIVRAVSRACARCR